MWSKNKILAAIFGNWKLSKNGETGFLFHLKTLFSPYFHLLCSPDYDAKTI